MNTSSLSVAHATTTVRLTPYALDFSQAAADSADNIIGLQMGNHSILQSDLPRLLAQCYNRRHAIELKPDSEPGSERDMEACEHLFTVFQNIDEHHLTPDGGRSLSVGDIARIQDHVGTRYFQCMNFGWNEIKN